MNRNSYVVLEDVRSASASVPILVDFDETLFLRNSTEEYLCTIKPRIVALPLLKLLDVLAPWQLLGKQQGLMLRDWVRVLLMTLLFPWSPLLWSHRAARLVEIFENRDLSRALQQNHDSRLIIASNGFDFIIRPLLNHMTLKWDQLIACRFLFGFVDRRRGKKQLVEAELGDESVRSSLLITDSMDDEALLKAVQHPHLVTWDMPERRAFCPRGYIPFFYMEKVKKTKQNFLKALLLDEFVPLALLLSWSAANPILHALGLGFMLASFWCIYEVGYMENDVIAETYESNPTLSDQYLSNKDRIDFYWPWFWSLVLALPGLLIWDSLPLEQAQSFGSWGPLVLHSTVLNGDFWRTLSGDVALWSVFLLITRAVYSLYNYIDEKSRTWLYPVLQVLKFAGFLLFVPANPLAIIYLLSLVNARWIPYFVYRLGNLRSFPDFPMQLLHAVGVFVFVAALAISGVSNFVWDQLAVILVMTFLRARKQLFSLVGQAQFFLSAMPEPPDSATNAPGFSLQQFLRLLFPKVT